MWFLVGASKLRKAAIELAGTLLDKTPHSSTQPHGNVHAVVAPATRPAMQTDAIRGQVSGTARPE